MAFCDLKPVCVNDENNGFTYIIGSVFAVYGIGVEPPAVYTWDMVRSVAVSRKEVTIDAFGRKFTMTKKMFAGDDELLRAIAIIEYHQKEHKFGYSHDLRLFPLKSAYNEVTPGKETYIGEGMLDEGDTAAAFIMLLNYKLIKLLWVIGVLIALLVFCTLHFIFGVTRSNVLYFIPIAAASGAIIAVLVYLITQAIARARFKAIADADHAARKSITFVISRSGFAACESCVYESRDLVPWDEMDYFIESDKMFILYKNNAPAAFIPKHAFDKKLVGGVADIIALHLEQR